MRTIGMSAGTRPSTQRCVVTAKVAVERAIRWEFWPGWLFNIPIVLWVAVLGVRYRSLTLFTLANPGIPDGGFVGESKSAILAMLPQEWVMPWAVVPPGPLAERLTGLETMLGERGWRLPLVFKPDVGQRDAFPAIAFVVAGLDFPGIEHFVEPLRARRGLQFGDVLLHPRIELGERLKLLDVDRDEEVAAVALLRRLVGAVHLSEKAAPGEHTPVPTPEEV